MHLLRRLTAVLSGALLLQLSLLGSGTLCGMNAGTAVDARGHAPDHTMAAMEQTMTMADVPSVSAAHQSDGSPPPMECVASNASGGCRLPLAPTSAPCATTMACVSPAAPSAVVIDATASTLVAVNLPDPGRMYSAPPAAPELPPPRA